MSTKTEMAPHLRKAVEEIDGDILSLTTDLNELQTARATLVRLYSGSSEITPTPPLRGGKRKPKVHVLDAAAEEFRVRASAPRQPTAEKAAAAETQASLVLPKKNPEQKDLLKVKASRKKK